MCFKGFDMVLAVCFVTAVCSCASQKAARRVGEMSAGLSLPAQEMPYTDRAGAAISDTISLDDENFPSMMRAFRDSLTGEMVAVDAIPAATVTARFRNVAERLGKVNLSFDIEVPSQALDSRWQLKMTPVLVAGQDTLMLSGVYVTGEGFRSRQERGYRRYRDFVDSILTDSLDFIDMTQLEIFLQRNFPKTYAMKTDTSFVSDNLAEGLFGIQVREAVDHFRKKQLYRQNEKKKERLPYEYARLVKSPYPSDCYLDTLVKDITQNLRLQYNYTMPVRKNLRKVSVSLEGELLYEGTIIGKIPSSEGLTFYVSSISSLVDTTKRYMALSGGTGQKAEVDTCYLRGIEMLQNLDYKGACTLLRRYSDYNAALSLAGAGYDYTALDILCKIESTPAAEYLKAILYARIGMPKECVRSLSSCIKEVPSYRFRANLDPELSEAVKYVPDEY